MEKQAKKIYVGSPANRFTGGPTLAHQLCLQLRKLGYDAYMYYYRAKKGNEVVHTNYKKFNLPYVTRIIDHENNIIVAPETAPDILKGLKKSLKIIWWMSVDNYIDKYLPSKRNKILNIGGLLSYKVFSDDNIHFTQSYYAKEYLKSKGVEENKIFELSDYIDDIFFEIEDVDLNKKENIIVYSPKRGLEFTLQLVERMPEYQFVPLENMSQREMIDVMRRSKLYVDFGNHPGKDRIPREAAICKCCVITSRRGSANNDYDVCIDKKYKFDDDEKEIDGIILCIKEIMENYMVCQKDFAVYRKRIEGEKQKFAADVKQIFNYLLERD